MSMAISRQNILLFFLLSLCYATKAQYPNDIKADYTWVLGYGSTNPLSGFGNTILHFNDTSFDTTKKLAGVWYYLAATAYSDTAGNLLMSSNGFAIYDKDFNIIPGGDSLNCCEDYAWTNNNYNLGYPVCDVNQIIQVPGVPDKYFHFQKFSKYNNGGIMSCSKLLLTRITSESGLLNSTSTDSVYIEHDFQMGGGTQLCRHANGRDWWLLQADFSSHTFYSFLIEKNGPVLKHILPMPGYLPRYSCQSRFSPDGSRFAIGPSHDSLSDSMFVALYDFDRCTGIITNAQFHYWKTGQTVFTSGLAFSPNSNILYACSGVKIFQYDLSLPNWQSTQTLVAEYDGFKDSSFAVPKSTPFAKMQIAPDNKIYICGGNTTYLHYIGNPDELGTACNVVQHGFKLASVNDWSMPNFPNYRLGPIDGSPCDTLGIDNIDNINEVLDNNKEPVKLYPNPTNGLFTIEGVTNTRITINDIYGRTLTDIQCEDDTYMLNSYFTSGVYVLKVSLDGNLLFTEKIVIVP